jgi:hypothetical protein
MARRRVVTASEDSFLLGKPELVHGEAEECLWEVCARDAPGLSSAPRAV